MMQESKIRRIETPLLFFRTHCVCSSLSLGIFFPKTSLALLFLFLPLCWKPHGERNMIDKSWFRERVNINLVFTLWWGVSLLLNLKLIFGKKPWRKCSKPCSLILHSAVLWSLRFTVRLAAVCQVKWWTVEEISTACKSGWWYLCLWLLNFLASFSKYPC